MAAKSFLESRINDTHLLSKIEKFKANLGEGQREHFIDLITLSYLQGEEQMLERWAEAETLRRSLA